ncbi:MAG TPA: T9SS type A sorting domain-containing protein [Ignavibacteriaceae bacterium]|nr:T9SS type A sorting domain-containing protein [Ignavibacteriaceae bacterium]
MSRLIRYCRIRIRNHIKRFLIHDNGSIYYHIAVQFAVLLIAFTATTSSQTLIPSDPNKSGPLPISKFGFRNHQSMPEAVPPLCTLGRKQIQTSIDHLKNTSVAASALNDTTPPSDPSNLHVFVEGITALCATWDSSKDDESGIENYAFAIGTKPASGDLQWWQSVGNSLSAWTYFLEHGIHEGDTIYFSLRASNGAGLSSSGICSPPLVVRWEQLGDAQDSLSYTFTGPWGQGERDTISMFVDKMLPVIKNIYGPPSHSFTVTFVKDIGFQGTNEFFPQTNEIHLWKLYPQLTTHELIHAFRDNVILASDSLWRYSSQLSGFEESFAQGVSYICMNKYIELYPNDPVVPGNLLFGSMFDWDYDYQNTNALTTEDFWSDGSGTGIYWLRYEMGAAAINKIFREYPTFPHDFNQLYYSLLNSDHSLRVSRELVCRIISQLFPSIEGRPVQDWIDRQHIFDCRILPGKKIWASTQPYPGYIDYLIFHRIFYYETFSNGSEWDYFDTDSNSYKYYSLNGSSGLATLTDYAGVEIANKDLMITPTDNPPVYWGFGKENLHLSTGATNQPWPGDDSTKYIFNLHQFGLYWLDIKFGSTETVLPRIMGDTLRNVHGIFGGVLHSCGGQIYLDHEGFPPEGPLQVKNGAYWGVRSWASVPNPRTGGTDTKPGKVFVTFVDDSGRVYKDERTIDYGSWSGNQLFLFNTSDMTLVDTSALVSVHSNANLLPTHFALAQNYPNPFNLSTTIQYSLPYPSVVKIEVYNVLGQLVAELINGEQSAGYKLIRWNADVASGIYFYRLVARARDKTSPEFVDVRKMILLK